MPVKNTLTASILMILGFFCLQYVSRSEDIRPNKPFSSFPRQIGEWTGTESRFDQKIYDVLGVDDSFLCNYRSKTGRQVQLYIGFYQSQREGDIIHSPKNCMPGGGWNIVNTDLVKIRTSQNNSHSEKVDVIRLDLQNGPQKQVVLYWFHSRGRIISSEYWQKIYLVIDSVTRHRTDGSFIRLIAPVVNNEESGALKDLADFAEILMPYLNEYIPS
ncbi:MAG: exosortase C-terminal domain/associated protein EpsI [Desulfococcaceae bacterium]|nr:exosortase C-terminal domain/associated protein EpsI [Desulfococcaceae bacterium]